jgi:hypothetical protein
MSWEEWFEQVWATREERVYRTFFGPDTGGIYTLDAKVFEPFQKRGVDPRWLTHGVLKFPPTRTRGSWLFATSGLSNPWKDEQPNPDGWSGLGCELAIEAAGDFQWHSFTCVVFWHFRFCLRRVAMKAKNLWASATGFPWGIRLTLSNQC